MSRNWKRSLLMILMIALVAGAGLEGCRKRKEKDKKKVTKQKPDNKKAGEIVYGQEVQEGNLVIFRGGDKVFFIKATPHTAFVGQEIAFEGACGPENKGKLTWNMGDNTQIRQGVSFKHRFLSLPGGQAQKYKIKATCVEPDGKATQEGSVTVTINPNTGTPQDPNQNPGQNPNQK